jgi:hypothetical protein
MMSCVSSELCESDQESVKVMDESVSNELVDI